MQISLTIELSYLRFCLKTCSESSLCYAENLFADLGFALNEFSDRGFAPSRILCLVGGVW